MTNLSPFAFTGNKYETTDQQRERMTAANKGKRPLECWVLVSVLTDPGESDSASASIWTSKDDAIEGLVSELIEEFDEFTKDDEDYSGEDKQEHKDAIRDLAAKLHEHGQYHFNDVFYRIERQAIWGSDASAS